MNIYKTLHRKRKLTLINSKNGSIAETSGIRDIALTDIWRPCVLVDISDANFD